MPRAKRSIEGAVTIEGFSLIWNLHREQQWFTEDGWKGIAIHVRGAAGKRRELFLEFPAIGSERVGNTKEAPARHPIPAAKVEAGIREAMAAGWDPDSRGKPYFYQVAE
jgi:hypothetical protein